MRLAFVTSGLEPEHDGVGDYTYRLAAACARRGHQIGLLALADRHVTQVTATTREVEGQPLPVQRLPRAQWPAEGGRRARTLLDAFAPDWISFQFVPHSYHPRGWFADSLPGFATALGGTPLHIFFHEIWTGSHRGASFLERVTGWRQRAACQSLLERLHPQKVQTSNAYYGAALSTCATAVEVLPVFGNVPVSSPTAPVASTLPNLPDRALVCGMFGTLHQAGLSDDFLADFQKLAAAQGRIPVLVSVGSLSEGEARFDRLAARLRPTLLCLKLGRRSPQELSQIFREFDFAVTSVPWNILGKSGTVAALREHGLKVVVTEPGAPARNSPAGVDQGVPDEGCVPYFQDASLLHFTSVKTVPRPGIEAVAARFLAGLEANAPGPAPKLKRLSP